MGEDRVKYVPWDCPSCGRHYDAISTVAVRTKKHCQAPDCVNVYEQEMKKRRKEKEIH